EHITGIHPTPAFRVAHRPLPHSPVLMGGLDLHRRFGIASGGHDLLGATLAGRLPLGAIATPSLESQ
ncbi:MAG: hypothetical protein IT580_15375, partial [Verrucomicrobiales bacterium]|nr:hypothetical protein [Verrucomicrobiales bacterium]